MHTTDCQDMDNFFSSRAPNTTLGLSLNMSTVSPCKESPPSTSLLQITPTETFAATAPLINLLAPSNLGNRYEDVYAGARPFSDPPVPLELLPLQPSSHKLSLSSSPRPKLSLFSSLSSPIAWQPAPFSAASCTAPSMSSALFRGIDMNQRPASADHDEIVYMSPGVRVHTSESSLLLMKRDRERSSDTEQERLTCEVSSRGSDEEGEGGGSARKKLRLSKEQSTLLEESFKEHSTLNPKQKAELARQLNLRPRQVEVWFQNRRARTKLKQTEVDCELLKRCCESLTEENRRLQKEVAELRAIKVAPPCVISPDLFMPLPAATLSICPSCQRVTSHGTAAPTPPPPASSIPSFSRSPPAPSSHHHHHHHHHQLPLSFPQPPPPPQHVMPSAAC